MANQEATRLNKYLSQTGICSRREADRLLKEERITVNGETAELGTKVLPEDEIAINGEVVDTHVPKKYIYLAFNKPIGIVTTTDLREKANIIDYVNYPSRIFPVGRLDKASEGLILLTDDGDIVNKILRSHNNHGKEYIVKVDRQFPDDFIRRMSNGIPILDTVTKKCEVERLGKFTFRIVLTQGLNRQIRRMCEYLGYEVVKLKRVRVLNIKLDVPIGKYRHLTQDELQDLKGILKSSVSVHEEQEQDPPSQKKKRFRGPKKR